MILLDERIEQQGLLEVEEAIREAKKTLDDEIKEETDSISDYVANAPIPEPENKPLDYVELFSYLWENRGDITDDYETYEGKEKQDEITDYKVSETLTVKAVDEIIMEKKLKDLLGVNQEMTNAGDREVFQIYKLFHRGLIKIKYSLCLS